MKKFNTFTGKDSIKNYLYPDPEIYTPLVELPDNLNKLHQDKIRIYAKLLSSLPLTNVKSIPAWQMLDDYSKKSNEKIATQVESSSGNTVMSLGIMGKHFGINSTKAYVSHEVGIGKLNALRFFGIETIIVEDPICPDPEDKNSSIYKTKEDAKKNNWLNPGQYENPSNPTGHYNYTGPQIWKQMNENIQVFCAGLGTTGTLTGTSKYLKEKNKHIKSVGVCRIPNNDIPGVRTIGQLKEISFEWKEQCDHLVSVDTKTAFSLSLELCRMGLLVGPSSGFNLAGLYKYLEVLTSEEKNLLRDQDGYLNCVFICCDLPHLYIEEYLEYLGEDYFPTIENQHLLKNKPKAYIPKNKEIKIETISSEELYDKYFINSDIKNLKTNKNLLIIDVREDYEWIDHHIPESIHIPLDSLFEKLPLIPNLGEKDEIVLVCKSGYRSYQGAEKLIGINIKTRTLEGGLMHWSEKSYPRIKNNNCLI